MATIQEENYHLKWHSFNNHLHSTVAKSFRSECFTDVALLTMDGSQLLAHRFVLSASSQYFQQVFRLHAKHFTTLPLMVVLPAEIKHSVLQILIQFMYCGEAMLPQEHMEDVMKAADLLKIKGLHRPKRKLKADIKSASPARIDNSNGHESGDVTSSAEGKNVYNTSPTKESRKSSKSYHAHAEKSAEKEKPKPVPTITTYQPNQPPPPQKVLNYSIPVSDHLNPIKESNSKRVVLPSSTKKVYEDDEEDNYYLFEDCDMDSGEYEPEDGAKKSKHSKRQDKDENQLYVTLTCDTCDEDFAEPADWVEHVQTAHGNSEEVSCQKRKRLKH